MSGANPPGLDLERLRRYLDKARPGLVGETLTGRLIEGGRSNLTYAITDGVHHWVVRRPPLGHVLPTAHDMAREYRVITALAATPVPVPATRLLCTDESVIGARFYVMDLVPGTPYRDGAQLAAIGPRRTHAVLLRLVDTLAELHAVDPVSVGLADFGRPDGFLERQLRRWSRQLAASHSRDLAGAEELRARLAAGLPRERAAAIVHGDYRLDNVLVDDADRITAVLDWEMSTLGDPLTDLALVLAYSSAELPEDIGVSSVRRAPGFPGSREIVARYVERSGCDVDDLAWYVSFAYFKIAVILEGIHYRFIHGQTVGADFERVGTAVPALIAAGIDRLDAH
ncbi:acyl-CoA dehydrogenase [Nocardiopsis ansamitocini]|uniref:Acyl-CoA dehydrogenase n=1 Tax=Nocardiopsis ansamitocini TaxID=1670832 RepID=A0A9W6P8D4_9ACTN|nr:phosphotransferase family protein [Nocardiopsis ansamitocini]GLU48891.1 acyl-CoA dehydrogenase [Nocardiopsis ansamitocini]